MSLSEKTIQEHDSQLYQRVENALESIRPYLKTDGGDVRLVNITTDFIAEIELLGNCSSCHISGMTLKAGVEQAVLNAVPEIKAVVPALNF